MTRKMKDSGIEWIGEIPEDWEVTRIAGLYSLRNTKVSDIDYPPLSVTKNGIVPQLKTAAKTNDHNNRKLVKKDDFVINSRSDRRGSCGISQFDGSVSLINTVLSPLDKMDPEYYNWLFTTPSFADEFYKWGNGIVDDLWTTGWSKMKDINVPSPSIDEQKKISKYLNSEIVKINKLTEKIDQQIQTLEDYKKSLITEAVTKGLDKNVEMKDSGIEWIGEIPKHWKLDRVKHNFRIIPGNGFPINMQGKTQGDYPVCKASDIATANGTLKRAANYLDKNEISGFNIVPRNSVIMAKIGEAMKKNHRAIVSCDVLIDNNCQGLSPYQMDFKYAYYLLRSIDMSWFDNAGTIPCVNNVKLKNFQIPNPPFSEQWSIGNFLDDKNKLIDSLISVKKEQLGKLEEYKKSLIYEYVTGKKEVGDAHCSFR